MARAIWSGSVSFGLVNVPVKLYTAVKSKDIHFNQLSEKTGARIRYKKVSENTGREVDNDDIVAGYEVSKGTYVTLTDEDFEAVEPERTHTIDIEDFVSLDEIDPLQWNKAYWVAPDKGEGSSRAYALLRDAMEDSGRVAIGRFVLRTKPYLVAIRPVQHALALQTLHFADEVIAAKDVEGLPVRAKASDREVKAARQLIDSLTVDWKPQRYKDDYREKLLDVIDRKSKGKEIVVEETREKAPEVVDLMAALEESIKAGRRDRGKRRTRKSA
jgi:DNA end-binding protein Ku